jgi:hypothetical protein
VAGKTEADAVAKRKAAILALGQRPALDEESEETVAQTPPAAANGSAARAASRAPARAADPEARRIADALRKRYGTDAAVKPRKNGQGTVELRYFSNDDLARLLELLLGEAYA